MSYRIIKDKLDNGKVVLLNGGTGSEIERLGVEMDDVAWCAQEKSMRRAGVDEAMR